MARSQEQPRDSDDRPGERPGFGKRFRLGWQEAGSCWRLIRRDPYLLVLPILSFAFIVATWTALYFVASTLAGGFYLRLVLAGALAAYPSNFVGTFFGVAFVALADGRMRGRNTTIAGGLRIARTRASAIAKWALLASGVGLVLQLLQHLKSDWIATSIFSWVAGTAWTVLTFFVVPVLAFENRTIRDTLRRSGQIVRERWGEGVGGAGNLATVFLVVVLVLMIPGMTAVGVAFSIGQAPGIAVAVLLGVLFLASLAVVTVGGQLFALALYRFATAGPVVGGFSQEVLAGAFQPRRRWRPWRR
jgi:hypothetical protein